MEINTGLYVPGAFYSDSQDKNPDKMIEELKNSGFSTIINWAFHVDKNGSITNQGPVTNYGNFVGSYEWGKRLKELKFGGSVNNLLLSFAGEDTFNNIKNLIEKGEDKKGGKLYNNFKSLYENMNADGIDLDNESVYSKDMVTRFSLMLHKIGFDVTFCPYTYMSFWVDCYNEISKIAPNAVKSFNLQCYSGGGWNNPVNWIKALGNKGNSLIIPGLGIKFNANTPEEVTSTFNNWGKETNLSGGFIWKSNDVHYNKWIDYSNAIKKGIKDTI